MIGLDKWNPHIVPTDQWLWGQEDKIKKQHLSTFPNCNVNNICDPASYTHTQTHMHTRK